MNAHDKAYELATALKESADYKEMLRIFEQLKDEPEAKEMLDNFREQQTELQRRMVSGDTPTEEEMNKIEKLYEQMNINPLLGRVFETERRLSVMMEDVNRIITAPLDELYSR